MENELPRTPDRYNSRAADLEQDGGIKEDLTGRDRLVSNVIFSWAGHFVSIIAEFIMLRMFDRRLGQELLGVWDFAWSLVSYFGLVQAGIGSSVNPYVTRYRIAGDISAQSGTVSSALVIMGISRVLVLGLTIVGLRTQHYYPLESTLGMWMAVFLVFRLAVARQRKISLQAKNFEAAYCL